MANDLTPKPPAAMSAVGLKLLELRVVEALNDVETAETRLNKERAKAGLTPAPK
jgi:hypothetical protein